MDGRSRIPRGPQMVRWAFLLRLAVPLLLAMAWATVFFRALILVLLALVVAGFVFFISRMGRRGQRKVRPTTKGGKKVIEGSYSIVDEEESPE